MEGVLGFLRAEVDLARIGIDAQTNANLTTAVTAVNTALGGFTPTNALKKVEAARDAVHVGAANLYAAVDAVNRVFTDIDGADLHAKATTALAGKAELQAKVGLQVTRLNGATDRKLKNAVNAVKAEATSACTKLGVTWPAAPNDSVVAIQRAALGEIDQVIALPLVTDRAGPTLREKILQGLADIAPVLAQAQADLARVRGERDALQAALVPLQEQVTTIRTITQERDDAQTALGRATGERDLFQRKINALRTAIDTIQEGKLTKTKRDEAVAGLTAALATV